MTSLASWTKPNRLTNWIVDRVAAIPLSVQTKLLVAFLTIVGLLIVLGSVGLQVLNGVNDQTTELIKLQRKIAAYRQVQHDTSSQLFGITNAMLFPDSQTMNHALRQLNQFGYDFDRLEFVAQDEANLLGEVRQDYGSFIDVVTRIVGLINDGRVAEAQAIQGTEIGPLADRLERQMSQLVNIAEADMVAAIDATERAYHVSQYIVIAFAVVSILLALGLGYVISWSLLNPILEIKVGLRQIAGGDFTWRVRVANRDEMRDLASHVNETSAELDRLYKQLERTSAELAESNRTLEQRVAEQVGEIQRMGRLKRFMAPQLADAIVASGEEDLLKSHRREITVLFADLRGFTKFSETAEPERLMAVLKEYHEAIGALIFEYEATLEHFAGDGVMVYLNDPLPCPDPAIRAVRLADAMRARVRGLTDSWRAHGDDLDFGIGIALGYATLGEIGFEGRVDYAAIGPVTNLASRLCDEAAGGQILISPRVQAEMPDYVEIESIGALTLKGFSQPVKAFNVVSVEPETYSP